MRIRRGVVAVLLSPVALTACADTDPPVSETVATDPVTTDQLPTAPISPSAITTETTEPEDVGDIPNDIPLGIDLWDARGDGGEYHPEPYRPAPDEHRVTLDLCDRVLWPLDDPVDQWWAWATGPEYGDRRELVVLPAVDVAVAAVETFRSALTGCERDGHTVWTAHDADTGYDSVTFTQSYTDGLGLGTYQVTRVGHAVLYTVGYGEGALGDAPQTTAHRTTLTKRIAEHMCVFTAAGCSSDVESTTPATTATKIPDDFPLAAGWPSRISEPPQEGLTGPNRTLPALEHAPCDVPAEDPLFVDRLRVEWSDIEDHRSRQLTLYETGEQASAALLAIVETYRSCPEHETNEDFTSHYALDETAYGDESWAVAVTETQSGGYPTTYLDVRHFIRVGAALLVDTDYGEGGAAPPGMLEQFMRTSAAEADEVIASMCSFMAVGC
jgi:hypothetical protein